MWDAIGELRIQTRMATFFLEDILCILALITWKLQVVYGPSTYEQLLYSQECLLAVLELGARFDWQVTAPNTDRSFFLLRHLCVLTYITWELQVLFEDSAYRRTALLWETFLVWFRVAGEIQLVNYGPRDTSYYHASLWVCSQAAKMEHKPGIKIKF